MRRIAEMLELLQHRVGQPGQEDVAAQHQHRQPVGVRQRRRCQKIGGARPGRRGAEHEALPEPLLGVGGRGKAHALLVLAAIERQFRTMIIERFAQAGDVAMAKNAEAAATQAHFLAVDFNELVGQVPMMACAVVSRTVPSFMSAVTSRRQRQILRIAFWPVPKMPLAKLRFRGYLFCNRLQTEFQNRG
jgi:hypothetical protein